MKIENADFGEYTGATTGQAQEERWQYEGIGYNATDGIFYVGKQESQDAGICPVRHPPMQGSDRRRRHGSPLPHQASAAPRWPRAT
jgi:hypothetical protein